MGTGDKTAAHNYKLERIRLLVNLQAKELRDLKQSLDICIEKSCKNEAEGVRCGPCQVKANEVVQRCSQKKGYVKVQRKLESRGYKSVSSARTAVKQSKLSKAEKRELLKQLEALVPVWAAADLATGG